MTELTGREDRRRGTERVAVDDHRPAGPPPLEKLNRRAHIVPRTIAASSNSPVESPCARCEIISTEQPCDE